jgi:hypothetical protein
MLAKHVIGDISGFFFFKEASNFLASKAPKLRIIWVGGQKHLGPLEKPLKMADFVFYPHIKKLSSAQLELAVHY